jgi:hypothetical protein
MLKEQYKNFYMQFKNRKYHIRVFSYILTMLTVEVLFYGNFLYYWEFLW